MAKETFNFACPSELKNEFVKTIKDTNDLEGNVSMVLRQFMREYIKKAKEQD